jgi:hypothetical protein
MNLAEKPRSGKSEFAPRVDTMARYSILPDLAFSA